MKHNYIFKEIDFTNDSVLRVKLLYFLLKYSDLELENIIKYVIIKMWIRDRLSNPHKSCIKLFQKA